MKASAGGGGKGMRVAWTEDDLADGWRLARDEAKKSFGDDRMLLQQYVCPTDGRHIEIQARVCLCARWCGGWLLLLLLLLLVAAAAAAAAVVAVMVALCCCAHARARTHTLTPAHIHAFTHTH